MKKLVLFIAAVGFGLTVSAFAEIVILKGGTRLELSKPYVIRGSQAILTMKDGTVHSVAAAEIDRDATAAARAAATRKPAAAPAASATSPVDAAKAQHAAPRAKVRVGDNDVAHDYAPGSDSEGEAADKAPGSAEARIEIADWDQKAGEGSVTIHGNVRNSGRAIAESVGLTVSVRDENGKTTGTSAASLPSTTLEAGAMMPFVASIAAPGTIGSIRFQPTWAGPPEPKGKSGSANDGAGKTAIPAPKPAPPPPPPSTPKFVPDPSYAPPAASATNQPDPDGHRGYLPGVEIPPPPPPPPPR